MDFFGDVNINGDGSNSHQLSHIENIDSTKIGQTIWTRGSLHSSRCKGKQAFVILRDEGSTIQGILRVKESTPVTKEMIDYTSGIPKESIIDVCGLVKKSPVKIESCSQTDVELELTEIHVISRAEIRLPVQIEDLSRSGDDVLATVDQDTRLDNRVIDLRTATSRAILHIIDGLKQLFRASLYSQKFREIDTPSFISSASEGGANVFELNYFKTKAYLAQSPQFYKQMAIASGQSRVFTVGKVFRAEDSNTHRHLTEFMGMDLEMAFDYDYHEVVQIICKTFIDIFKGFEDKYSKEIEVIRLQYKAEPFRYLNETPILKFPEAVSMLRAAGAEIGDEDDLTTANEKLLGRLVKEKYDTDFFVLDKFPLAVRPFYTMPDPGDGRYSNSYDMFMRGEEVLSGAQRIHDAKFLTERAKAHKIELSSISSYIDAFKFGCRPHAGGGIGQERFVMLYLGLDNIRKVSMFPRDPKRLTP